MSALELQPVTEWGHGGRPMRRSVVALAFSLALTSASLQVLSATDGTSLPGSASAMTLDTLPAGGPAAPAAQTIGPAPAVLTPAFAPGHALPLVLETIRGARVTLDVAAYAFTSKPIAVALRDAHRRGVRVRVVVDAKEAASPYSAARFLANARIPVRLHNRHALQHNKFIVVDGTTVQTGSFNYTTSAQERNAENVLVVHQAPQLAAAYALEWQRLWEEGTELSPAY